MTSYNLPDDVSAGYALAPWNREDEDEAERTHCECFNYQPLSHDDARAMAAAVPSLEGVRGVIKAIEAIREGCGICAARTAIVGACDAIDDCDDWGEA